RRKHGITQAQARELIKKPDQEHGRREQRGVARATSSWLSSRTPRTTSSEMEVALRSSRTRTTVPSRISRTIGSSASERAFHASQSLFTLRQTRLTVSLPTAPPNRQASARRTRRVLVPAR